jgi:hypothetical protein
MQPFHQAPKWESGSHCYVQSSKYVRMRVITTTAVMIGSFTRPFTRLPYSLNESMVWALQIFAHGIEPKVREK